MSKTAQTFFSRIDCFFGGNTPQNKSNRSRAGLLLTLALLPALFGVLACLPVPVGDPEKSRIDPAISGIWIAHETGLGSADIYVFDPYDKRTWLLTGISMSVVQNSELAEAPETDANKAESKATPPDLLHPENEDSISIQNAVFYKSWLTRIKGVTFITWEARSVSEILPGTNPEVWFVFRVRHGDDGLLYLDEFDYEIDGLQDVKTRKEAEKIIRRHVKEPAFYKTAATLYRVPESDYKTVSRLLKDFGIEMK